MTLPIKPCPLCGGELTEKNLAFFNYSGEDIYELSEMVDLDRPRHHANVEAVTGEKFDAGDWRRREGGSGEFRDLLDDVDSIVLQCPCGFAVWSRARDVGFPDNGWYDKLKKHANRRSGA